MARIFQKQFRWIGSRQRQTQLLLVPLEQRETPAVSGLVFQDFNANGQFDTTGTISNNGTGTTPTAVDRGLAGITVNAYDANNTLVATTSTNAAGSYTLNTTGFAPLRVEFENLPPGVRFGLTGSNAGSAIQFVPATATNVNLALNRIGEYSPDNPTLVTSTYVFAGITQGDFAFRDNSVVSFPYSAGSADADTSVANFSNPTTRALGLRHEQVGATWGLGYNSTLNQIYAAAFFKRHTSFGPGGPGAIYSSPVTGSTATQIADLNSLFGDFPAGNSNDIFRDGSNVVYDRNYTGDLYLAWARDGSVRVPDARGIQRDLGWDSVGKYGLGGLDVSDDDRRIYVMALGDRRLYSLPTDQTPTSANVERFDLPIPSSVTGTNVNPLGDLRPFAVEYHQGLVYIGAVNSAESTGQRNDLKAYVFAFDPVRKVFLNVNRQPTTTEAVFTVDLNYDRGNIHMGGNNQSTAPNGIAPPDPAEWNAWVPTLRTIARQPDAAGRASYPQPMLTGLAFDSDGNLALGIRDRSGDQLGKEAADDPRNLNDFSWFGMTAGDTLRAFINTPNNLTAFGTTPNTPLAGWTLENNGRSPTGQGAAPQNTGQGPGGAEYFYEDDLPRDPTVRPVGVLNEHDEVTVGGILQLAGSPILATTVFDPIRNADRSIGRVDTGGVRWFDATVGDSIRSYELYKTHPGGQFRTFAKANGVGDLVAITLPPPIEIGNYIWNDTNRNGRQDADELPANGVVVQLFAAGTDGAFGTTDDALIGTATTNAAGEYYFSSALGTSTTNRVVGLNLTANTAYQLRLPLSQSSLSLKTATVANASSDSIDSDATVGADSLIVTVTTGAVGVANHTFDIGIIELPLVTLGDFVWNDLNNDGLRTANEPGLGDVVVNLYANDGVTKLASTKTDTNGSYQFTNLFAGKYIVEIVPPSGFTSSTGQLGSDNGPYEPGIFGNLNDQDHGTLQPNGTIRAKFIELFDAGNSNNPSTTGKRANDANLTVDFGLIRPLAIGDVVFEDLNNNGFRDLGEAGLASVVVNLRDSNGSLVATTTTNGEGGYLFPNLVPGTFQVEVVRSSLPSSDLLSSTGTNGSLSGPFEPAVGNLGDNTDHGTTIGGVVRGPLVALNYGTAPTGESATPGAPVNRAADTDSDLTQDFGFFRPLAVGNFVWDDLDNDGTFDLGESGVDGVAVELLNSSSQVVATTQTANGGQYRFDSLVSGTYSVRITPPARYVSSTGAFGNLTSGPFEPAPQTTTNNEDHGSTTGNTITTAPFALLASGNTDENGRANLRQDFGIFRPLSLGNFVWEDTNNNGKLDTGENPIDGVSVALIRNGLQVGSTTTANGGQYLFSGLPSGTYTLRVTTPNGFVSSTGKNGSLTGPYEPALQTNANNEDHGTINGAVVEATVTLTETGNPDDTGFANFRQDFSFFRPQSIGNLVFEDANNNGLRDAGEAGIDGVTVELLDESLALLGSTTTSNGGQYLFTGLGSGTYSVRILAPNGLRSSTGTPGSPSGPFEPAPQTNDDNVDHGSSQGGAVIQTLPLTLGAPGTNPDSNGLANLRQDFGLFRAYAVGNFVWNDVNNNGRLDASEKGIGNVPVELLAGNTVIGSMLTNTDGFYRFDLVPVGTYQVRITRPAGFISSTGANGQASGPFEPITATNNNDNEDHGTDNGGVTITPLFSITATGNPDENGTANLRQDFGLFQPMSIGNLVFADVNNNGLRDKTEAGISGVAVELLNETGNILAMTTTDGDGKYQFTNLGSGTYSVRAVTPAGLKSSTGKVGSPTGPVEPAPLSTSDDTDHGTATGTTATAAAFVLGAPGTNPDNGGLANLRQDFGFFTPLALGNLVFEDKNNNGTRDTGEAGLANVIVELLDSFGVIASTKTNSDGVYRFSDLAAGEYVVRIVRPEGFVSSTGKNASTTGPFESAPQTNIDNTDHGTDSGPFSLTSTPVTLTASGNPDENGTANLRQDFGLFRPLQVGNQVFRDLNNNGVLDGSEVGIAGIAVRLLDAGGSVIVGSTTDSNGNYRFTNIIPGDYRIEIDRVSGLISSTGTPGQTIGPFETTPGGVLPENPDDSEDKGNTEPSGNVVRARVFTLAEPGSTQNPDLAGTANLRQDFGFTDPIVAPTVASVSGFVYRDTFQRNGIRQPDEGETGISNVLVTLVNDTGSVVATTRTDSNGFYQFTNLAPGSYRIVESQPDGFDDGADTPGSLGGTNPNNDVLTVTLQPGDAGTEYNFGEILPPPPGIPATVSGFVYRDTFQANGIRQPSNGESGIQDVLITLQDANGQVVASTRTDATGFYQFTNLAPGTYTIVERQPLAFNDGIDRPGSLGGTNPRNDMLTVELQPGDAGTEYNFGEVLPPSITNPPPLRPIQPPNDDPTKQQFLGSSNNPNGIIVPPVTTPPIRVDQLSPRFGATTGRANPALVVTGAGVGESPTVRVFDYATGIEKFRFDAYETSFTGGVRVATGDINGDGAEDVIVGTGIGGGPRIRIYDGVTGVQIREFFAFEPTFRGGIFVSAGDIDGDGAADLVVGAEVGGGPRITTFSGRDGSILNNFFAFDQAQRGGTRVAVGDFNSDGRADIVASTGASVETRVRVFDGTNIGSALRDFSPFESTFTGGVNIAAGDINGDGRADIITGAEAGGGPRIVAFDGQTTEIASSFFVFDTSFRGGVRVAVEDVTGDGRVEIVAGAGIGRAAQVRIISAADPNITFDDFIAGDSVGGVYVG